MRRFFLKWMKWHYNKNGFCLWKGGDVDLAGRLRPVRRGLSEGLAITSMRKMKP